MHFLIIFILLLLSGISEADDLWLKYDLGDSITINSLSNFGESIWIATGHNGILKLNRLNGTIKTYDKNNGLPDNIITSVCCEKNGLAYTGVMNVDSQSRILSTSLILINGDSLTDFSSELLRQYRHRDFGDSVFFAAPLDIPSIIVDNKT